MKRRIQSVQSLDGGCEARLDCGHRQYLGEPAAVGEVRDCIDCDRFAMPADFVGYKQTPVFTHETLPDAIRNEHSTKAGVWARIHVLRGRLRYEVPSLRASFELSPQQTGIVVAGVPHAVTPLGEVEFYVQFFRATA